MKKTVHISGIVMFLLAVLAFIGAPLIHTQTAMAEEKVIKWKLQSHFPPSSTSWEGAVLPLCKQLKERTNGRLVIEPFTAGSLVPSKEIFNSISRGMFQMGTVACTYFQNRVPLAAISAGLPFSFKKFNEVLYFHRNLGFEKMMRDACGKFNVYYSSMVVSSTELAVRKPVRSVEDFKGLKLRSTGTASVFLTKLGAAAAYIAGPEIYPALASGVVDGAHWGGAQGALSMNFWDVAKYHHKPGILLSGGMAAYLVSQKAIDQLPKDIQEIFYRSLDEQFLTYSNAYETRDDIALGKGIKEKGVKVVWYTPEAQQKMTEVAIELWDKEAEKAPECAEAVKRMKEFLKKLGYI